MKRLCFSALQTQPDSAVKRGQRRAGPASALTVTVASVSAALTLLGSMAGSIGALRAAEMPRFITHQKLHALQEALLAYTAEATAANAHTALSFQAAMPARHPADGMPPEFSGAPDAASGPTTPVSTIEFHSTLNAARRDAGEARELADEVHRRATEISDRFARGSANAQAATLTPASEPAAKPLAQPPAVSRPQPVAEPRAGKRTQRMTQRPRFSYGAAMIVPSMNPAELAPPVRKPPQAPELAGVGDGAPAVVPPSPSSPVAAPTTAGPAALGLAEAVAKGPANSPAGGLMGLGGAKNNETARLDPPVNPGLDQAPPAAAVKAPTDESTRTTPPVGGPEPSGTGSATDKPAYPVFPTSPASAAAAYGFVPLSRPKDRTPAHVKRLEDAAPPRTTAVTPPTKPLPAKSAPAKAGPRAASLSAATPPNVTPKPAAATGSPAEGATKQGTVPTAPQKDQKDNKGLFSWFKPLGKPIEMPRDIRAFGWPSE